MLARFKIFVFVFYLLKGNIKLESLLEPLHKAQNSRFGSAMSSLPDLNGDGSRELVVGAPLEDDHKGAIYLYYSQQSGIRLKHTQVLLKALISRPFYSFS